MRTQTEGSVVTAVMKREFQTHKIITLSFAYINFLEATVKFKGAVSRNSAKLGNHKMPVKLRET